MLVLKIIGGFVLLLIGYLVFLGLSQNSSSLSKEEKEENNSNWGILKFLIIAGFVIYFIRSCGGLERFVN